LRVVAKVEQEPSLATYNYSDETTATKAPTQIKTTLTLLQPSRSLSSGNCDEYLDNNWLEDIYGQPDYLSVIPWNIRPTWILLQSEIRTFSTFGLLAPFYSRLIKPSEHYRNFNQSNTRKVAYPIIKKLLQI
jgi:hypothetical protein